MPFFNCRAILFDLDGVLADSTAVVGRQWRIWAVESGVDPDELLRVAHGRRTIEVVTMFRPDLTEAAAANEVRKIEEREAADIGGVRVIPGAIRFLQSLPRERWAVVTSGTRFLATSRLRHCGLPEPAVLVSADEVTNGKPHPEPYLLGAAGLGVDPTGCLVFEDAPAGIEAAHAAGMKAIAMTTTYPKEKLLAADAYVSSFENVQVVTAEDGMLRVEML